MSDRVFRRAARTLLIVLAVSLLVPACGPSTATLKLTVKGEDGQALADLAVTVGDRTVKTDSKGLATISRVPPGQVTVKFKGGEYNEERTVTVRAGVNKLTCELESHAFAVRPFVETSRMRIRVTQSSVAGATEGTFVRGKGVHWKMAGGSEVISLFDRVYVKSQGGAWQLIQSGVPGQIQAEAIAEMVNQLFGELQAFDARVAETQVQARWISREQANSYDCRVFEVNWGSDHQTGSYRVYVIAQGQFRGFVTRYLWNVGGASGTATTTFDVYDIDGQYEVAPPT